jgi:mannose-1-phosphate guanylyltransferase
VTVDRAALAAAHARSGAVLTIAVERRADVSGAAGVVVVGGDGRVVGYQLRPDPAEALSDVVDTGEYAGVEAALEYMPEGARFGPEAIVTLLEHDIPIHAFGA